MTSASPVEAVGRALVAPRVVVHCDSAHRAAIAGCKLLTILLVVLLCCPPLGRGGNLGDDWLAWVAESQQALRATRTTCPAPPL